MKVLWFGNCGLGRPVTRLSIVKVSQIPFEKHNVLLSGLGDSSRLKIGI